MVSRFKASLCPHAQALTINASAPLFSPIRQTSPRPPFFLFLAATSILFSSSLILSLPFPPPLLSTTLKATYYSSWFLQLLAMAAKVALLFLTFCVAFLATGSADPDLLQDVCVADFASGTFPSLTSSSSSSLHNYILISFS